MTEDNKDLRQPTSAKAYRRRKQPFLFVVSPSLTVLMRPVQMEDAFFQNLIPMPATAVQAKFEELQKKLNDTSVASLVADPSQMAGVLEDPEINMMDYLRRYACAAVIDPVIVMEDDGNEDHIPVTELSRFELLQIFNADPSAQEPPLVAPQRVEEFRRPEPKPDDSATPSRENVRPEAQLVDLGERETITA